ncbi:MAG: C-type lectin domain-containing protein [Kofleriaceae bacterium]
MKSVLLVMLVGCSARLGDATGPSTGTDADSSIDGQVSHPIDAAPDAKVCMGGDAHMADSDGNCFQFFTAKKIFADAKTACDAAGAHLAKLENKAQNDIVAALSVGVDSFIGATDAVTEGTFLWEDGTPLTYKNFHTGEPNNGGSGGYQEDCLVMAGARAGGTDWDDRPCTTGLAANAGSYAYTCEY